METRCRGSVAVYALGAGQQQCVLYHTDGYTDTNGNYVTAVVGGLERQRPLAWRRLINASSFTTITIFSQPPLNQNGGTNITVGQAVLAKFLTAILGTNHITGHVKFTNATNIVGRAASNADATIGGGGLPSPRRTRTATAIIR